MMSAEACGSPARWRRVAGQATLVVLNPGDKEMPPPSTVPARRVPAAVPPGMPPPPPPAPAAAPPRRSASRVLGALSPTRLSSRAASGVSEASSGGGAAAAPPSVTTTVVEVPARSDFDVQELSGDGVEAGARAPPSRRGGAGAEDDGVELETLGGSS